MQINLDEKIEVAKKLNLNRQVSRLKFEKSSVNLKFKPITLRQINKRLNDGKIRVLNKFWLLFPLAISGIVGMFVSYDLCVSSNDIIRNLSILGFIVSGLLMVVSLVNIVFLDCFEQLRVVARNVTEFEHSIPYGAMLAMQEAKEKGIENFEIYYPVWGSIFNITDDPIIIGRGYNYQMLEIYAWNEDDVYES